MMKVLHIMDNFGMGGIQSFVVSVCKQLHGTDIQFEFLTFRTDVENYYADVCSEMGWKVYCLPGRREGILQNKRAMRMFFSQHHDYQAVHYHASSLSYITPIIEAWKTRIPIRIVHSHSTKESGMIIHTYIHKANKKRVHKYANYFLACGECAGKWLYGGTKVEREVQLINNGVKFDDYVYDENVRQNLRKKMRIEDCFVLGHVGRFSEVKNQSFILDVFSEIVKMIPRAKLMLIGDGPLRKRVEEKAIAMGISDNVIFMGARDDVSRLLQVMDVFILPSLYEGFPVAAVEAQASGLPVLMSDTISREVMIKSNVEMLSLEKSPKEWADKVLGISGRDIDNQKLLDAGFDICNTAEKLYNIYMKG